jgi:hypothetical protein
LDTLSPGQHQSTTFQLVENMKRIKEKVKPWAFQKRQNEDKELKQIESELQRLSEEEGGGGGGGGVSTPESKITLLHLEKRRNKLLKEKEESWRLKSRAIWLASGDENTKFFQAFAKGRRNVNTIWQLKDLEGNLENTFEGMSRLGKKHFQNLFKAENQASIEEVVQMAQLFPRFVDEADNRLLMEEVTEKELKEGSTQLSKRQNPRSRWLDY